MKLQNYILAIIVIVIFGCQTNKKKVVISGKISGKIQGDVEYTSSENGACFWGFPKSIQMDSSGSFNLTLNIDEPIFFQPLIGTYTYGTAILEPGENYNLIIDLNSKENNFKVQSSNSKGQELYNSLPKAQVFRESNKFIKDSIATDIINKIESIKEKEIVEFKKLLDEGEISNPFYNFVKKDRECYYSTILGNVALLKFYENNRTKNGTFPIEIENMWNEIFNNNPFMSGEITSSFWSYPLIENYLKCKEFTDKSFNMDNLKDIYNQGQIHTHNITLSKKHLNGNILEYFNARYLYSSALQMEYEKELITLFEEFKTDFPKSDFSKFLNPLITPISEYLKIPETHHDEKIKFVDNYENINSLKECIESFKGKKVYVDVWASWCLPCRAAFKYKEKLKELLNSKDVEMLYLSIDNGDRYEKQWKEMIKFYNLEGNHIRANRKLNNDLRRIYNKSGSMTIPWYILIDENGDIIIEHAESPSHLKELEKQINEN